MTRYAVALGSNQGERLDNLIAAVEAMRQFSAVEAVSSLYETEPVGGPEQDPFLNAVVMLDCPLAPLDLLDRLQKIELDQGRTRTVKWGPRTLDLDIVAADGLGHSDDRLTIPHALAGERAFVLVPLVEIWPDAMVGDGVTAASALQGLNRTGIDRLSGVWLPPVSRTPSRFFVAAQLLALLSAAFALAADGELPDGEVTVSNVAGAAVAMTGLFLAFVSSRRLGPSITPSPLPPDGARLVMTGPYRYARHTIYGGVFLVILGTALLVDSIYGVVAAVVLLVFFWFKSDYEERQLRMRFAAYRGYRQVVQRRFIPFVI